MNETDILRALLDLADEVGLRVRPIRGGSLGEGEPSASSGVVRVRGEPWVVLSGTDSVRERIAVLAGALRAEACDALGGRFLPPALRELLEPDS